MDSQPQRRFPVVLVAAILFNFSLDGLAVVVGISAQSTSDIVCFKQPAYMRLHTPHFSVPTYGADVPLSDSLNSYPTVVFYYLNYAAFKAFGFGLFTSLAVDLLIHLTLVTLAAGCLWRLTGNQLSPTVFLIVKFAALAAHRASRGAGHPAGPDRTDRAGTREVGAARSPWWRWGSPESRLPVRRSSARRCILPTMVFATASGGAVGAARRSSCFCRPPSPLASLCLVRRGRTLPAPWLRTACFASPAFTSPVSLLDTIWSELRWAIVTLPVVIAAVVMGLYCVIRKPSWFPRQTAAGAFVVAAVPAICVGFGLNCHR